MKKTITVNIGNYSFTIDEDAHLIIKQYLDKLNAHYGTKEHGKEIIESIEERMAELLTERITHTKVVTTVMVQQVIEILGTPSEIDPGEATEVEAEESSAKRQFFRDTQKAKIGGVIAGLAVYLKKDVTILRLFIAGAAILFMTTYSPMFGFMVLGYLLLWIIVPPANTTTRRYAMYGEPSTIDSIKKKVEEGAHQFAEEIKHIKSPVGQKLGRAIEIIFGLMLLCLSLCGLLFLSLTLFGLGYYGALETIFNFSSWLSITLLLVVILPLIGWLYGSILLLFKIKAPRWKPGIILFVIWLIAIVLSIPLTVGNSVQYWKVEEFTQHTPLALPSDTLYVVLEGGAKYEDDYVNVYGDHDEFSLNFLTKTKGEVAFVSYPDIELKKMNKIRWNDGLDARVEAKTHYFTGAMSITDWKEAQSLDFYSEHGDTITINPLIYSTRHENNEVGRSIDLYINENTTVILESPVEHQFNRVFRYYNFWNF